MSAFCGVYSPHDPDSASPEILERMAASLRHVAPSSEHIQLDRDHGFALAFLHYPTFVPANRETSQPWRPGEQLVVLDGSLYDIVGASGVKHLASAYEQDPESFPAQLDGYYRALIWDRAHRRISLANDRLGNHNFCYYATEDLFVFATELKAVLEHPAVKREVDLTGLATYLSRGYVCSPRTIVKGVSKSMPGQVVSFETGRGLQVEYYWRAQPLVKAAGDLDYWVPRTRDEVTSALLRVSAGATRVAVPFSGGVDSSIVAAVLKDAGVEVLALTAAWPDVGSSEDADWSAKVAQQLGTEHRILEVRPDEVTVETAARVLRQFDEPIETAGHALAVLAVNQAARESGVPSLLDGNDCEQLLNAAEGSMPAEGTDPGELIRTVRDNLLTGRLFSVERQQTLLARLPDGLEDTLKGFIHDLERLVGSDYYPELHTNAYFLRIPGSRYGFFTEAIASLNGMEERRGFRDYRLFEFARTIPNEVKGSRSRGTRRQLVKTAFKDRLPHLLERTDDAAAPGDFRSVPSVQPAFLALARRAGETGLLRQEAVDRLTERYLANPLSSAGERFRAVALFLVWHAFYIEGRDPFAEFS